MKKLILLLLVVTLGLSFSSCKKDEPSGFSPVGGSWVYSQVSLGITESIRFTFKADGSYSLVFTRVSPEADRDKLDAEYNDEQHFSGRYSHSQGKVTILSLQFDGFGERFAKVREEKDVSPDANLTGLVLLYDPKTEMLRVSRELSSKSLDIDDDMAKQALVRER